MVRCKSAIVPPWPFVGSGVAVVVVAREVVLQRLVGLGLVAAVLALAPSADASPPDQTWIAGLYDNADFDEVILFITTGLGDVQPGLLCSPRQVILTVGFVSPADTAARTSPSAVDFPLTEILTVRRWTGS